MAKILNALTIALKVKGCTDSTAANYNPDATSNDGSCFEGALKECVEERLFSVTLFDKDIKASTKALKTYIMYQSYVQSVMEKNKVKMALYKEKLVDLCNCTTC